VQRWRILKDANDAGTFDPADQPVLDEAVREVDRLVAEHGERFTHDDLRAEIAWEPQCTDDTRLTLLTCATFTAEAATEVAGSTRRTPEP
jgi:hypothetical protein